MAKRTTVVVSQGQSLNPAKRELEEQLVTLLMFEPGVDVALIPHLYDLTPDGTGMLALQGIPGDMVLLSWLYPRAAHWVLDRNGIAGKIGDTLLKGQDEDDEEEGDEQEQDEEEKPRVIQSRVAPNRTIYCLDLRASEKPEAFVEEVKRIAAERSTQVVDLMSWVEGSPPADQVARFVEPQNDTALDADGKLSVSPPSGSAAEDPTNPLPPSGGGDPLVRIEEKQARRWYPVIDFSRCTNCMECIDFCLFGVYGIDKSETILVEQPDNCRKGCPACSRVCPENAIIFPQHKTPAIAGSASEIGGLKIDLSKLFGAPDVDPVELAARERDEQLMLAGRDTVGLTVGIPKRQADQDEQPKDDLDDLIDALDDLDV